MTIRQQLTLWYAGILLLSVVLTAGMMYFELIIEPAWRTADGQPSHPVAEEIAEVIFYCLLPLTTLTVVGGWWLLRKALTPLENLAKTVGQLQACNLREPLPRSRNGDEVDRLTEALNASHARLEEAFKRIRDFTLNASHELKTPLALLHGEIEAALGDPETSPHQREVFSSQLDEIQRLGKIVSDLSLLAKADAGQAQLRHEPVNLHELVQDSFADAQILALPRRIKVHLDPCEPATLHGDRHRLRQLLLNLTDNAIKYNEPGGTIGMFLRRLDQRSELVITNTGPGIAPERLPRVFDRFYRGDESHNHDIEGSGLGLSIAQWIVEAHGGTIQITSADETRVTVTLPLGDPAAGASPQLRSG
jgi:signal transduction histidine kinase